MLEFHPLMTNAEILTCRKSSAPKTATFPASFPRGWPEGKGYSLVVADGASTEWKGEGLSLLVPVVGVFADLFVIRWGGFVSLPRLLEDGLLSVSLSISVHKTGHWGVSVSGL